ncbi:MAG: hypothetical protein ABIK09_21020, partial [Pseudomonadota bacterium]
APCGLCGLQERTCLDNCTWSPWGACTSTGTCAAGAVETLACGACGLSTRSCTDSCQWSDWSLCTGEGACLPGELGEEVCGSCGVRVRSCNAVCQWNGWSACQSEGVCAAGEQQTQGCGNCGTRSRTCTDECYWSPWGTCEDAGACAPGQEEYETCGNCGVHHRTCAGYCQWGAWSPCMGQGECFPSDIDEQSCGSCGTQVRSCSGLCNWGLWGGCEGQGECYSSCLNEAECPKDGDGEYSVGEWGETAQCGTLSLGIKTCLPGCVWGACQEPENTECNCLCSVEGMSGCRNWDPLVGPYDYMATNLNKVQGVGCSGMISGSGCTACDTYLLKQLSDGTTAEGFLDLYNYEKVTLAGDAGFSRHLSGCNRYHASYLSSMPDNTGYIREHVIHIEGPECDPDQIMHPNLNNWQCIFILPFCAAWHDNC